MRGFLLISLFIRHYGGKVKSIESDKKVYHIQRVSQYRENRGDNS
jgi:hypothetical protein